MIERLILKIDDIIDTQINEIVEHPVFCQLRSRWLGLLYLTQFCHGTDSILVKMLDVNWETLCRDLINQSQVDYSYIFDKIYYQGFGHPGAHAFSLLVCDYEINIHNSHRKDLHCLQKLGEVASLSFAPAVLSLSANSFGDDSFADYDPMTDLEKLLSHADYRIWQQLRERDFARFLVLTFPQIMCNSFAESVIKQSVYYAQPIWYFSSSVFFLAGVVMNNFNETGWFSDLNGINNDIVSAGLIPRVSAIPFSQYTSIKCYRALSELVIYEHQERIFTDQGLSPVCYLSNDDAAYFITPRTICTVSDNTDISYQLNYLLCVSRFIHYLKIIGRSFIGRYSDPVKCESVLKKWLSKYVASNPDLPDVLRHRFPLRKAVVDVSLVEGCEHKYNCNIWLSPNLRTNQAITTFLLTTDIS